MDEGKALEADLSFTVKTHKKRASNQLISLAEIEALQHQGASVIDGLITEAKALRMIFSLLSKEKGPCQTSLGSKHGL